MTASVELRAGGSRGVTGSMQSLPPGEEAHQADGAFSLCSRELEGPMLLVPKQLMRAGMTGNVPYYGGRFTPTQAYAASHPDWRPGSGPMSAGGSAGPQVRAPMTQGGPPPPPPPPRDPADTLLALQHLLDTGVITPEEYDGLRSRVGR